MIRAVILAACALAFGAVAIPVDAKGTARIQQKNGSVQVYPNVTIRGIGGNALTITSADSKGTLIVTKAACSFAGEVMRCLPYSMALAQGGSTKPIDFDRGTVYYNSTDTKQQLPLSSTQLPPKGILAAFLTKRGTYITVTGTVDGVTR
jgi:hypothetical protein